MKEPVHQSPPHRDFHTVMSTPHWEELLSLYYLYRDYMKHEDDLINQRSSWHLLLQGFLFATFGVLGEWQAEGGAGFLHSQRYWILYGIIGTGLLISLFATSSILAADAAINKLHRCWDDLPNKLLIPQEFWELLPGIAGAGSKHAKRWGKTPAIAIPIIIALAWSWILGFAIYSQRHPIAVVAIVVGRKLSVHRDWPKRTATMAPRDDEAVTNNPPRTARPRVVSPAKQRPN
jgi:hypothetical protein